MYRRSLTVRSKAFVLPTKMVITVMSVSTTPKYTGTRARSLLVIALLWLFRARTKRI